MKPRLRIWRGVWSCVTYTRLPDGSVGNWAAGYGYTPRSAYDEWRRQA